LGLGALLLGGGYSMHLFIFVEGVKIFLHLRDLILKMQPDAVVHAFKASVKWRK
jgi:hypothetical protein